MIVYFVYFQLSFSIYIKWVTIQIYLFVLLLLPNILDLHIQLEIIYNRKSIFKKIMRNLAKLEVISQ